MEFQREPGRIYAMDGDKLLAEVIFHAHDGVAEISRTFVDDSLRGQGVAGKLVRAAVDQIRADGQKAAASCSYAEVWFQNHPEEADLLER